MCDVGGIVAPFLLYRLSVIWLELPLIIFGTKKNWSLFCTELNNFICVISRLERRELAVMSGVANPRPHVNDAKSF